MKKLIYTLIFVLFLLYPKIVFGQSLDRVQEGRLLYQRLLDFSGEQNESPVVVPTAPLNWVEHSTISLKAGRGRRKFLYLILVDNRLYDGIKSNVLQYAEIISQRKSYKVRIVEVNHDAKPEELREMLKKEGSSLDGCLFIGNIGMVYFQEPINDQKQTKGKQEKKVVSWPCDLYFMDLDGIWEDNWTLDEGKIDYCHKDQIFDTHRGNTQPEIFIGRLPCFYKTENILANQELINRYLKKAIKYWLHQDGEVKGALSYVNKTWACLRHFDEKERRSLTCFERVRYISDYLAQTEMYPKFSKTDYLEKLSSSKYSYVRLMSHSSPAAHYFDRKDTESISDLLVVDKIFNTKVTPRVLNLFCCSALLWSDSLCLGASYIYGPQSSALAVVGSAKTGSMYDPLYFNESLAKSFSVGESLCRWWKMPTEFPVRDTKDFIHWHYGLTIFGDPLVTLTSPVDLWMKDDAKDMGVTPNNMDNPKYTFWESDDIWIRNYKDGVEQHQNPIYRKGEPVYVYARIRNRGVVSSSPARLMLRWAHAGISLDYNAFQGMMSITGLELGGPITPISISIPSIPPGGSVVVSAPWFIHDPRSYDSLTKGKDWHYCMLAEVESPEDPILDQYSYSCIGDYVKSRNNVVMKNIYNIEIGSDDNSFIEGIVSIHNPYEDDHKFTLSVEDLSEDGHKLAEVATVSLELSSNLHNAMMRNGATLRSFNSFPLENRLTLESDHAYVDNLQLPPKELGVVNVKFNFDAKQALKEGVYGCRVLFIDNQTGAVLGGETYRITKHPRPAFDAKFDIEKDHSLHLLKAEEINEPASYRWRDHEGRVIGEGPQLKCTNINNVTLEVESLQDGVMGQTTITPSNTLQNLHIYPNPAIEQVQIDYSIAETGVLKVVSLNQDYQLQYTLSPQEKSLRLDVRQYPKGMYIFSLIEQGKVIGKQLIEIK